MGTALDDASGAMPLRCAIVKSRQVGQIVCVTGVPLGAPFTTRLHHAQTTLKLCAVMCDSERTPDANSSRSTASGMPWAEQHIPGVNWTI
jgi:hypothetical protein